MDNIKHYKNNFSFVRSINKSFLIKTIRKITVIEILLQSFLFRTRKKKALLFMKDHNLFPYDRNLIISDYMYSIKITFRSVLQVLNIESIVRAISQRNIKGAFVEAGTYTGGASAYGLLCLLRNFNGKKLPDYWGFDSFEGMPSPTVNDGINAFEWLYPNFKKNDVKIKKSKLIGSDINLADYSICLNYLKGTNYPAKKINLIKGWFQDTLKVSKKNIGKIAILRIDGDFYDSTLCVLDELYDNVSKGGVIILDDYGNFEGSRKATHFFFKCRKITPFLHYVDHSIRYFIKP
jgi:O-methyltransferase